VPGTSSALGIAVGGTEVWEADGDGNAVAAAPDGAVAFDGAGVDEELPQPISPIRLAPTRPMSRGEVATRRGARGRLNLGMRVSLGAIAPEPGGSVSPLAQRNVRATVVTGDALVGPPILASLPVDGV
jgi:hypothetical protein